jgi:hypothetical protein
MLSLPPSQFTPLLVFTGLPADRLCFLYRAHELPVSLFSAHCTTLRLSRYVLSSDASCGCVPVRSRIVYFMVNSGAMTHIASVAFRQMLRVPRVPCRVVRRWPVVLLVCRAGSRVRCCRWRGSSVSARSATIACAKYYDIALLRVKYLIERYMLSAHPCIRMTRVAALLTASVFEFYVLHCGLSSMHSHDTSRSAFGRKCF